MDQSQNESQQLKSLVEDLNEAKRLGMRGEIIDMANALKVMCTKLLQEMVNHSSEQEEDPSN